MIKNDIKTINGGKESKYGKDFVKTKIDTDDDLALNKPMKFPTLTIIVGCVFQEDKKLYLEINLDESFYEFTPVYQK